VIAVFCGDLKKVSPVMWGVGVLSALNLVISVAH
jgi:hypothetical protein